MRAAMEEFRAAFAADIHNWSWGDLNFARTSSVRWQDKKGTLEDESIFGPRQDYQCFCGRVVGREFQDEFCPFCGSDIEKSDCRSSKFATIALGEAIPHPFEAIPSDLWIIPVLPASLREKQENLDRLYDEIIVSRGAAYKVAPLFDAIIADILPRFSSSGDREEKVVLGRGMAITPRHEQLPALVPLWKARICSNCHAKGWEASGTGKGDITKAPGKTGME